MSKIIHGVIQTHMSSTRLPNKVMLDVHGKPELYRVLERVRQSRHIDDFVVATSTLPDDDIIEEKCREWGLNCYRGSDTDVLDRYYGAVRQYPCDIVYRITSDNPLNDHRFIDDMIDFFFSQNVRYVGGNGKNPVGVGGEVFTAEILEEAARNATDPFEREHVSPYMYMKQDSFARFPYPYEEGDIRITMDTPEDYRVIQAVYDALYKPGNTFSLRETVDWLRAHPEIRSINSAVIQKADLKPVWESGTPTEQKP